MNCNPYRDDFSCFSTTHAKIGNVVSKKIRMMFVFLLLFVLPLLYQVSLAYSFCEPLCGIVLLLVVIFRDSLRFESSSKIGERLFCIAMFEAQEYIFLFGIFFFIPGHFERVFLFIPIAVLSVLNFAGFVMKSFPPTLLAFGFNDKSIVAAALFLLGYIATLHESIGSVVGEEMAVDSPLAWIGILSIFLIPERLYYFGKSFLHRSV
jgi:hypothetical protein